MKLNARPCGVCFFGLRQNNCSDIFGPLVFCGMILLSNRHLVIVGGVSVPEWSYRSTRSSWREWYWKVHHQLGTPLFCSGTSKRTWVTTERCGGTASLIWTWAVFCCCTSALVTVFTNSMLQREGARRWTWHRDLRGRRLMIGSVLSPDPRPFVLNSQVTRGAELSADPLLAVSWIRWQREDAGQTRQTQTWNVWWGFAWQIKSFKSHLRENSEWATFCTSPIQPSSFITSAVELLMSWQRVWCGLMVSQNNCSFKYANTVLWPFYTDTNFTL